MESNPRDAYDTHFTTHDIDRDVPFVGTEAGQNEQYDADEEVGRDHVQPDLDGERVEE